MPDALVKASALSLLILVATLPWTVAPMSIALVLCAALTILVWQLRGPARWVKTPVDLPALGWILALAVASLFALDPRASWPRVVKGLLLILIPVSVYHARDERIARRAVAVLLVSAGLAAVFALTRFVLQGPEFPNRVKGAVGHPLTYGGQAMLVAALASALAIRCEGRWRLGALLALGVILPALAGTYTRSAWIGYLAALVVIVAFTRARWLTGLGAGVAALALVLPGAFRERAFSIFDPQNPWNRERVHMWEAGLRMFRDHPFTGVGLQDLHSVYERYKSPGAVEAAGHLHSVYVHVAATMGIVGLLALAFLIVGLFRAASRAFRDHRLAPVGAERLGPAISLGVTAALAGFLVSGLMEWNVGDEELLDLLYVMIGIAFAAASWARARRAASPDPDLLLVERIPDQSLGDSAMRRRIQETSPPRPAR
ncbi:MAG TPA: O-antigen ligase family protein [Candidatus Saccharimonadales bacterium]|nr:O-antigen ligase family protein [Candidatus Saccharimonadales bacterium]